MMNSFKILICLALLSGTAVQAQIPIADAWKFQLRQPPKRWIEADFDDSRWAEGNGGFGNPETPGARVGTHWGTDDIWLRKTFKVEKVPQKVALLIHHDEDAQVYLNGKLIAEFDRWTTEYQTIGIDFDGEKLLREGDNLLAVHCHQTGGGQFIDVHVVDAAQVPELPPAKRNTSPFKTELITQWGADVTPENAWAEYPRPRLARNNWTNLNGLWDYTVTADSVTTIPAEWMGKILVPFCAESKLSGVQRLIEPNEALWYHRTIDVKPTEGKVTLLNFEAVDYKCDVFFNGALVGKHIGGHTPFSVQITPKTGANELVVRVEDETEGYQLNGKQTLNPRGIWYTQVTGIWQTVWLEEVSPSRINDLKVSTDATSGSITINPDLVGMNGLNNWEVEVVVRDGAKEVARAKGSKVFNLTIPNARLWSPDSPHLYDIEAKLVSPRGTHDVVQSYAGIRTVGKHLDANGHWRFVLNGNEIFHFGPLDQGWWPDGLLTPPSDAAMAADIEYLKAAGFNMIRKHIKVEPRRYYYHCDKLGMMMWQDQVSAGHNPPWTRMEPNPKDADWPEAAHKQYMVELDRMITSLESHACIVCWVPFNEAWGQHRTIEVGKWTVERDPTRLVNIASGGNFWPVGDIADHHNYPHPDFPFDAERYKDFVTVVGEFGGHGYPVEAHLWDTNRNNWGYGGLPKTKEEYLERYATSIKLLIELKKKGIAGGVYTQTTDVEGEINGLLTYDRKVIKIPAQQLKELHQGLYE